MVIIICDVSPRSDILRDIMLKEQNNIYKIKKNEFERVINNRIEFLFDIFYMYLKIYESNVKLYKNEITFAKDLLKLSDTTVSKLSCYDLTNYIKISKNRGYPGVFNTSIYISKEYHRNINVINLIRIYTFYEIFKKYKQVTYSNNNNTSILLDNKISQWTAIKFTSQ